MKIRQIRFRNINSFYGEHEPIQFTSGLLGETGLFVISGPTGAGKSTLLDVITLALFNRFPRLSGTVSNANVADEGLIVNRQAAAEPNAAAYAEVEYEVEGALYRSRWSIRKNRNNNWNDYSMEIARLTDNQPGGALLVVKNLRDFPKKNEELIGLSYEQFVKSIVLAQGAFDQFLKARATDRSRMLEQLTGTEIYRHLSRRAYEHTKWLGDQIDTKRIGVSSIRMLSAETVADLTEQLEQADAKLADVKAQIRLFDVEKKLVDEAERSEKALAKLSSESERLSGRIVAFAPERERLDQHDKVTPLAGLLTEQTGAARTIGRARQQQTDLLAGQAQLTQQLDCLLATSATLVGLTAPTVSTATDALVAFRDQLKTLQDRLMAEQQAANPLLQTIRQQATREPALRRDELGLHLLTLPTAQAALERLQAEQQTLQDQIDALQTTYPDLTPATLIDRIQQAIQRDKLLGTLALLEEEQQERIAQGQRLADPVDSLKQQLTELGPLLAVAREREQAHKATVDQLENEQRRLSAEADLEQLRAGLTAGDPCPLCGSLEHPYATHYVNRAGTLAAQLLLAKADWQQANRSAQNLSDRRIAIEAQLTEAERTQQALREQFRGKREEINALKETNQIPMEDGVTAFRSEQQALNSLQTDLNNLRTLWEQRRILAVLARQLTDLHHHQQAIDQLTGQKQTLYTGDDWAQRVGTLLKQLTDVQGQLTTQAELQRKVADDETAALKDEKQISAALAPLLKKQGLSSADDARSQLLDVTTTQKLQRQRDELDRDLIELEQRLTDEQRRLDSAVKGRKTDLLPADVKQTFDEARRRHDKLLTSSGYARSELDTNRKSVATHQKALTELEQMEADRMPWTELNRLIGSAKGDSFSKFAQSLTLAQLIGLANRRLKNLTDRYLLLSPKDEQDELFVVDLYQGQAERTITSLSGGESFTLSLALALGLSDLASHNVQIDSLFIDEGFGTLDPESLDTAIVMLEKLQQESQKTIGIISHRHEIKERITVQIQVERGIDGNSRCYVAGGNE